jgi:hypothetical protein
MQEVIAYQVPVLDDRFCEISTYLYAEDIKNECPEQVRSRHRLTLATALNFASLGVL